MIMFILHTSETLEICSLQVFFSEIVFSVKVLIHYPGIILAHGDAYTTLSIQVMKRMMNDKFPKTANSQL